MPSLVAILCALSLAALQVLYGGLFRPIFTIPAFMVLGLAGLLGAARIWKNEGTSASHIGLILVGCFTVWMVWREIAAPDGWLAASYLRLTLACALSYLLFATVAVTSRARLVFVGILCVLCLLQALYGLWQSQDPASAWEMPWLSEQIRVWYADRFIGRARGFYLNGNHLSWLLNSGCFFAATLALWGRFLPIWRILFAAIGLICLAASLSTASRGGAVSLGAGVFALALFSLSGLTVVARSSVRKLAGGLLLGGAAFGVGFLIFANNPVIRTRWNLGISDSYRNIVFEAGIRQAQISPLLGTGPGSFIYHARQYRTIFDQTDDVFAHNDWLQIAADFGFPALVVLALVLLWHLGRSASSIMWMFWYMLASSTSRRSTSLAIQIGAASSLVAFAVHSWVDFNMQVPANALLAAICLGIVANHGAHGVIKDNSGWDLRFGGLMSVLLGLFLLYLTIKAAPSERKWLEAENAILRQNWLEARIMARAGLVESKEHPGLLHALAAASIELAKEAPLGDRSLLLTEAGLARQEAIRLEPKNAEKFFDQASLLLSLNARHSAIPLAVQGIVLGPQRANGYELYGEILFRDGKFKLARHSFLLGSRKSGVSLWNLRHWTMEETIRRDSESR